MASDGEQHPELIAQFVSNLTGQQYVFVPPSNRTDEVETMGTDEVETMGSYFQRSNHNACNSSAAQARTSIAQSNTTTNNKYHYHFQCAAQTLKKDPLRQLCTIMKNSTEVRLSKKNSKEFKAELKKRGEY